jgi:hypothetical protein
MSTEAVQFHFRRGRRWAVLGAVCSTVVAVAFYLERLHPVLITVGVLSAVIAWCNLLVQIRALHSISRSSSGKQTLELPRDGY